MDVTDWKSLYATTLYVIDHIKDTVQEAVRLDIENLVGMDSCKYRLLYISFLECEEPTERGLP